MKLPGHDMLDLARRAFGEPNRRLSRGHELRWGKRGSVAANPDGWYDHETGEGGGPAELLKRWKGLDRKDAYLWLRKTYPGAFPREERERGEEPRTAITARSFWQASKPVPLDESHPARRWAARRNLWHPQVSWPATLRWMPANGNRAHQGAGSLVAALCEPQEWHAWHTDRSPAAPAAVQLISITAEGAKALDRPEDRGGLDKRTLGSSAGRVWICGVRRPGGDGLAVAEGVADAMALASRYPAPAAALIGTANFGHPRIAEAFAEWDAVAIYSDSGPGGEAASAALRAGLDRHGVFAPVYLPQGGSDPAEALQGLGFSALDDEALFRAEGNATPATRYDAERRIAMNGREG